MNVIETMFSYISLALFGGEASGALSRLPAEAASPLFALANMHDVAPLVAEPLEACGALGELAAADPAAAEKFRRARLHAIYRHERQMYELERIRAVFEREKIEFLPLKGIFMKGLYPEPWLRTCNDLDILVSLDDLDRAVAAVTSALSYKHKINTSHDVSLVSPSGVVLELHHSMLDKTRTTAAADVLSHVREHAERKPGSYELSLDMPMFIFMHLAHMVEHFVHGGCGVRPFVDLCVLRRAFPEEVGSEKTRALLREGGLLKFAEASFQLVDVWFFGAPKTEDTAAYESYIISGGVYGSLGNMVAVTETEKSGFLHYVGSRLFVPYEVLEHAYPPLHRHPWLLPFYQVRRWFDRISRNGLRRYAHELKVSGGISHEMTDESRDRTKKLRKYLGV